MILLDDFWWDFPPWRLSSELDWHAKGHPSKFFPLNIWSSMSRVIFMPLFKKGVYRMCVSMYQWKNEWAILLIMNHWPPLGRAAIFSLNHWITESLNQRPTFGQGAAGESQGAGTGWTELGCCTVLIRFLLYMIRFFKNGNVTKKVIETAVWWCFDDFLQSDHIWSYIDHIWSYFDYI